MVRVEARQRSDSVSVYIDEIRVAICTMFSHRKVLLNWQTVCVFLINGFVYCSIFVY